MVDFSAIGQAFGNAAGAANKWFENPQNLTKFTTIADAIGVAGGSPFAGVATAMNQSKLANQARLDQNAQTQALLEAFGASTGTPAVTSPSGMSMGEPAAIPQAATQSKISPDSLSATLADIPLTTPDMDGVSSYTVKPGKEGGKEISMKISDIGKKKDSSLSLADMTSRPF